MSVNFHSEKRTYIRVYEGVLFRNYTSPEAIRNLLQNMTSRNWFYFMTS